jgi:hypothetical protein
MNSNSTTPENEKFGEINKKKKKSYIEKPPII